MSWGLVAAFASKEGHGTDRRLDHLLRLNHNMSMGGGAAKSSGR